MTKIEISAFEKELRYMLTDSELALLDRYLGATKTRDGGIASLVANKLRQYAESGVLDLFHDKS